MVSPQPAPRLFTRTFWLTLWLAGVAYMVAMAALSAAVRNTTVVDYWWWTAIPVAWTVALLVHFSSATKFAGLVESFRSSVRRHPGWTVFYAGMAAIVAAFVVVATPSGNGPTAEQMRVLELAAGAVIGVAAVVGFSRGRAGRPE